MLKHPKIRLQILFLLLIFLSSASGTSGAPRISLLTVGPGRQMYQLEGHSALRIVTDNGDDVVVNWGVFDFNTPNFAYRFVKGETDYSIGMSTMSGFLADYAASGRYITEQPLNLTEDEAQEVIRLVGINLQPQNRVYRYRYFSDNCATRPLDIIEKALAADGATLEIPASPEKTTIRNELRAYHENFPAYQLFIDFALGSEIDKEVTTRQRAFAPIYLMEMAEGTSIKAADGVTRPLTSGKINLKDDSIGHNAEKGISPMLAVILLLIATIAVTVCDIRRKEVSRWYDTAFYAILGLIGCLSVFLVFVSVHEATSPNINLMWANPLCLIIPLFIWFKKCKYIVFYFQIINFALLLTWMVGQPLFCQSLNIVFIPLVISDMLRSASYIYLNRRCINHIKA